jgi:polyisoprenoid-binding protein YceI
VTIDASSVDTGNQQRDDHIRTEDFLNVAAHPELTFVSTAVRAEGEAYFLDGDLTVRGVTKPVTLEVEPNGFADGFEGKIVSFSATTEIKRSDFGVTGGGAGAILGEAVKITLEIEAGLVDG